MATYHLYVFRNGMLVGSAHAEAADPDAAARLAPRCERGAMIELWEGDRRLRIIGTSCDA